MNESTIDSTFVKFMAGHSSADSYSGKKEWFKRKALTFLSRVSLDLQLQKGTYTIRYNQAGPACSGDAALHHDKVYITFNADRICDWILFRSCKGQHDYTGGTNRQQYWHDLSDERGYQDFLQKIKTIIEKEQVS